MRHAAHLMISGLALLLVGCAPAPVKPGAVGKQQAVVGKVEVKRKVDCHS